MSERPIGPVSGARKGNHRRIQLIVPENYENGLNQTGRNESES